ncbi:MAG: hypothetical protein ACPGOV_09665 [Magnetovibrionaceae bacterium]
MRKAFSLVGLMALILVAGTPLPAPAQELETCWVFCYEKRAKGPWCSEIFDAGRFIGCQRQGFGFFNMCWERHIKQHPNIEARGDASKEKLELTLEKLCGVPL